MAKLVANKPVYEERGLGCCTTIATIKGVIKTLYSPLDRETKEDLNLTLPEGEKYYSSMILEGLKEEHDPTWRGLVYASKVYQTKIPFDFKEGDTVTCIVKIKQSYDDAEKRYFTKRILISNVVKL